MMNNLLKPRTWLRAISSRLAAFLLAAFAASCAWAATPLAVWDGNFDKTSINGVTFDANGNTVAEGGSTVTISGTKGALFKIGTGYNYVVGVFTVKALNETAASNRVLALWDSSDSADGNARGVYLPGGEVTTRGVWANKGTWEKNNTTLRGTLATDVSTDTERTFALVTVNSDSSYFGTHLYEISGDEPSSAVYGTDSNNGLRTNDKCKTLCIGGPGAVQTTDPVVAFTGLVITRVAIYGSDSAFPVSASDMASYVFPGSAVVGSGETLSVSEMNSRVSGGAAYVEAKIGATITVDTEPSSGVVFWGSAFSMSGNVAMVDGVTLDLANTTLESLVAECGTSRSLTISNGAADYPVTVILDEESTDAGTISFTATGDFEGTYKVRRTDGHLVNATYSAGTITYPATTGNFTITLTGDATVSAIRGTDDYGAAASTLTIVNNTGDCTLTIDEDMANSSITFQGTGNTTLCIANGATFTAPATFTKSGTGSVIVKVDAGGTAEINGKQSFLVVPTKFVLNGGSLVNNGANIGDGNQQITTLELTADSMVGGTKQFGLIGSRYGDTTLTLNGHTLVVNITGTVNEKLFFMISTLVPDDGGTIRVDAGVLALYYKSGATRQNQLNCTVQLNNEYYMTSDNAYAGTTYGFCELFMGDSSQPTVKNVFATNAKGGTITGYANNRILTITGTLGLPFKAKITPNITLADGATVKALTAGGAECPTYGLTVEQDATIYVDVSAITLSQTTPIFTWTSSTIPNGNFVFTDENLRTTYELLKEDGGLYIRQYTSRSTVNGVVTPSYSLTTAIQNADDGTEVDVFTDSTESAVSVSKDATISFDANNVTINTLTVSADSTLTLVGSGDFTIGAITGEGALSLDLTGYTGSLSVPVDTTFASLTGATGKITVTGTVAKGTTLFTVGSGIYTPTTIYSAALESDVHYTIDTETGAYVVGKTYYWISTSKSIDNGIYWQANTENNNDTPSNWSLSENGSAADDIPLVFDTAVFKKTSGAVVMLNGNMPYNISVEVDTIFLHFKHNAPTIVGIADENAEQPVFTVDSEASAYLRIHYSESHHINFYSTLEGEGIFYAENWNRVGNRQSQYGGIEFYGDMSNFRGSVSIALDPGKNKEKMRIVGAKALDNSYARWSAFIDGTYPLSQANGNGNRDYTLFALDNQTYKFGSLKTYISNSYNHWSSGNTYCNQNIVLELGEKVDEDSWLRNSWGAKTQLLGGTVIWKAATATFTNEVVNSYNVTLSGGGNVYIPVNATTSTDYIPTQIAFTDNGGYLTIDDDNAEIAENIIGAISSVSAPVGFNVTAASAVTAAAPSALQSGVSFNKKGTAQLTLTGITSLGTVTVAKGAGALVTPKVDTYTLGTETGVTVGEDTLTFYHAAAKIGDTGYGDVETAITALLQGNDRSAVAYVYDDSWIAEEYEYASMLPTYGIMWESTARTYAFAAAYINTASANNYKATIAAAIAAATSGDTIHLFKSVTEDVVLPAGVSLNPGKYTLTGTVTAADGCIVGVLNGVYTSYANTTSETWEGTADGNWGNASNWSLGFVPAATTPVVLPSKEAAYTIHIGNYWDSHSVNGTVPAKCSQMTVNGDVTLAWDDNRTYVGCLEANGNIVGTGMLTLNSSGIYNMCGSALVIDCALVMNGVDHGTYVRDSFLTHGNYNGYTINGNVTVSGYARLYDFVTFNGDVTVTGENGYLDVSKSGTTDAQPTFNGGVTVGSGATIHSIADMHLHGTLDIAGTLNCGTSTTPKWLKVYNGAAINLDSGILSVCRLTIPDSGSTATLNFNGGTLSEYGAGSNAANIIGGTTHDKGTITLNVKAGGAVIDTGIATTIAYALAGDAQSTGGGLTKTGDGALTLSAAPTFTGAITVEGGSVVVPVAADVTLGGETYVSVEDGTTKTLSKHSGYAADSDGTAGDETVAVPLSWVKSNVDGFDGMTEAQIVTALAANSATLQANGYNYFTCYALGLNPADADDKPLVSVSVDANGNFVVTLTDKDGTALTTASNVTVTPSFYKYNLSTGTYSASPVSSTIAPADVVGEDNVGYIRAKIDVSAE